MEILGKKGISHEAQKQAYDCDSHGSARRPRRRGRLRAGQVLAEIAERNRVLRLQGIRGLGGGLFRPDRRGAQGDRRQSDHDRGVQGRRPGQRPAFPAGSKSAEAPFVVDVPDVFTQAFVMEKDSARSPKSGGWGYALFNYEAASDTFAADPSPS